MAIAGYVIVFICAVIALLAAFIYAAPATVVAAALQATRRQSGLQRKEITLPSGLHFAYLEGGQGEPLLLLHGFGGNKDTFTRVARYLIAHYHVIIPDIIGFGESDHLLQADYSSAAQVERLRELSQALNLKKLHLGGNSMGAQIALQYASRYPTEIDSLWLLSPAVSKHSFKPEILKALTESSGNPLIARNVQEFQAVMALGMYRPPYIPKPMLKVLAQEHIQNAVLEADIFQQLLNDALDEQIQGMQTPSLIVFGNQDRVIAAETANVLNKLLTNTQLVFVVDAGHVPMFEKPQYCANDYVSFRAALLKS